MYEKMISPEKIETPSDDPVELDHLKKIKSKKVMTAAKGIRLTLLAVIAVVFVFNYVIGYKCPYKLINYDIAQINGAFEFSGNLTDGNKGVSSINYEEKDGVLYITVKSSTVSPFHRNSFDTTYECQEDISKVCLTGFQDTVIWCDGEQISLQISELYNSYFGHSMEDEDVLGLINDLGLNEILGNCSFATNPNYEPKSWMIETMNSYTAEEAEALEKKLPKYGTSVVDKYHKQAVLQEGLSHCSLTKVTANGNPLHSIFSDTHLH
jgi:hypothetical protein